MDRTETDGVTVMPSQYDKTIQLFTYLKDLCALRSTQIRNIASYDHVFWFNDVPHHKLCRCSIWNLTDSSLQIPGQQSNIWIEVRKPTIKSHPELPDELDPWVKDEELMDSSLNEPGFYEEIPLSSVQNDSETVDNNEFVSINNYPQIFNQLVEYIETKWKPWAIEDRELQKVQKAYNQLFNIYQRQEKFGEQYEVIVGTGLLLWKSPNSGEIKRHILTIQARIEFNRIRGIMSVVPALDGSKPFLDCGMLETTDRPNPTNLNEIENDVIELDGDPWNAAMLELILRGFSNSLPIAGNYSPSLDHIGGASEKPSVRIAPALILRKRTHRTFEDFYRQIIDQLNEGEEIPENIRRIIEIVDDPTEVDKNSVQPEKNYSSSTLSDSELYFPLPANEEQKRIAQKIEYKHGVLVQGPPGTGKSHSICNLIAHFLARGKRILVTSETPRALEVLRHKLHKDIPEIEELCVVWLGSGPDSQTALEKSVSGITQRKANWNETRESKLIEQYILQLNAEREKQAKLQHDLRACKESDVYQHSLLFNCYSGTLQQIAQQINKERDKYQWFVDKPSEATDPLVSTDELLKMSKIDREFTPELKEQLKYHLYPIDKLIKPDEFSLLINDEQRAGLSSNEAQDKRSYRGYSQLALLDRINRDSIKSIIESILAKQDTLSKHFHSWAERASREISGDQDRVWRQILTSTLDHIKHIESLLNQNETLDVMGLDAKDLGLVKEHAIALKKHLEIGKGLGFWIFREGVVKEGIYLIKTAKVNGKACDNVTTLNQLLAWIDITTRIKTLGDLWKNITQPPTGNEILQCSVYRDLCEPIEYALTIYEEIENVRNICQHIPSIHFPVWHLHEEIKDFARVIDAVNLEEDFETTQKAFVPLAEAIMAFNNSGNSHTSTEKLLQAVNKRDNILYRETYDSLSALHNWANDNEYAQEIHLRFQKCAPRTFEIYNESYTDASWDNHFLNFNAAYIWAKTDRWLDEFSDKEHPKQIQRMLESSVVQERDALKNLAASKAWQHCITNLGEKERMALIAWQQAIKKIRGGKGKYVETYRETARQKLDECRGAIPGWVMPLYQVVQTIRPRKHQFDIVIIDEASQSGPEALLLNYIADKIIVVGDDKQITPMHVGVDRDQVLYLSRKHLRDIPHKEALDLEGSLFSQAELRFPDRIRLREHFRCMPEIIQFSNNLSYTTEPLIPLRQHGASRLEPVRTTFVENGYRKGSSDDIENLPEAEAIVAQIADCCEDPTYEGKTFGIISLMGTRQTEVINRLLLGKDGIGAEEIEKRRLICGRPYDFQGDERDVIFLSMVDAPQNGQLCRMFRDADTQRRFNVSASRARDQVWLFHSASLNDLRPDCLRYKLLEYCLNPKVIQPEPIGETNIAELRRMSMNNLLRAMKPRDHDNSLPFDSWFEVDVFIKIIDRGYRILPQYHIPNYGYRIDLVVEGMKGQLAVECDGDKWHGPDRYEYDNARQRNLIRCGWIFCRIRGRDFYRNPDNALTDLWETLEKLKITPCHKWKSEQKQSDNESTSDEPKHKANTENEYQENHEDGVDEEEIVDSQMVKSSDGRLDRVMEYARTLSKKAEKMPPFDIQNAIIKSLKKCPNYSCTLESLTGRVLKELGVLTRGNPRLEFEKRVMRNLGVLERKGIVEKYKAKNKRIRLLKTEHSRNNCLF